MTGRLPKASSKLVKTLRRLQKERDPNKRQELVALGRKALMNWFRMGAYNLIHKNIPITKPTQKFIDKNINELRIIANKNADETERQTAILKRGGAGFLGGVIIRSLLKWGVPPKKRQRKNKNQDEEDF